MKFKTEFIQSEIIWSNVTDKTLTRYMGGILEVRNNSRFRSTWNKASTTQTESYMNSDCIYFILKILHSELHFYIHQEILFQIEFETPQMLDLSYCLDTVYWSKIYFIIFFCQKFGFQTTDKILEFGLFPSIYFESFISEFHSILEFIWWGLTNKIRYR